MKEYWEQRRSNSIKNMSSREKKKILIEVAAQHPLDNGKPNEEFTTRLIKGMELYKFEKQRGNMPILYVPGSLHSIKEDGKWKVDERDLSSAGEKFLLKKGIPAEDIRAGEVLNRYYKEDGVYNSGDECYIATRIAEDENCGRLISVVSPVQLLRKGLFYENFGYIPEMYSAPTENTFHNYIGESFWSLYITYYKDHDWQDSFMAYKTREERDVNANLTEEEKKIVLEGIKIPDNIKRLRTRWMELYTKALENRKISKENNTNYIDITFEESIKKQEINQLIEIYNKQKEEGKNVIVRVTNPYISMDEIENLKKEFKQTGELNIPQIIIAETPENIGNIQEHLIFKIGPSDEIMGETINYIKFGNIPMVYGIPRKNGNYTQGTLNLFKNILRGDIEHINQIIKQKENRGVKEK